MRLPLRAARQLSLSSKPGFCHQLRTAAAGTRTRMQHSAAESYAASTYPPLPPIADSNNIASMVCCEWPAFGEQPAIIDGTTGATRTYAELTAGVDALAAHLVGLGLTPGQLVALVSPNDLDYATVLLAALKLGLTVSPMNPTLTADEMELQLRDAHVAMVVGSPLCPQAQGGRARTLTPPRTLTPTLTLTLAALTPTLTLSLAVSLPRRTRRPRAWPRCVRSYLSGRSSVRS